MRRALRRGASAALPLLLAPLLLALGCGSRGADPGGSAGEVDPGLERVRAALARFQSAAPAPPRARDARTSAAREHLQAGRLSEARAVLEPMIPEPLGRAPERAEASDEALLLLGIVHQEAHRPALAAPLFEAVLARGPTFPGASQAFYFYGKTLAELGRPAAARAAFEADLALFPESGDAWFQLALLDVEAGEPEAGRAKLEEARARFRGPRDVAKVHARLGDLALAADDLVEAERQYQACVRLFPHYEVYYKLAGVARRRGDEAAAEEFLRLHAEGRERAAAAPGVAPRGD